MIVYFKLWRYLYRHGYKRIDLLNVVSGPVLAKLGKNENVNVDTIAKICDYLNCQPADIMENIRES